MSQFAFRLNPFLKELRQESDDVWLFAYFAMFVYRNRMDIIIDGKFKMVKKIGSGAFGDIYKGKFLALISDFFDLNSLKQRE